MKKTRLTKQDIEEARQEFIYINQCFTELVLKNFNIEEYKDIFDETEETLKYILFYEINIKCATRIQSTADGKENELVCEYRLDNTKLPKLVKIEKFKRGFKLVMTYKDQKIKSALVNYKTFISFINTYNTLISAINEKILNISTC